MSRRVNRCRCVQLRIRHSTLLEWECSTVVVCRVTWVLRHIAPRIYVATAVVFHKGTGCSPSDARCVQRHERAASSATYLDAILQLLCKNLNEAMTRSAAMRLQGLPEVSCASGFKNDTRLAKNLHR